jgi:hypothetical protein
VAYVRDMLAQKKKISGFGHRVYHTEDPRATHLRKMSEDLGHSSREPKWFEMSRKIEQFVKAEKKLNANVDFYSASTYHVIGIDVDIFTPIFAVSRISGWRAQGMEQLTITAPSASGRLHWACLSAALGSDEPTLVGMARSRFFHFGLGCYFGTHPCPILDCSNPALLPILQE